MRGGNGDAKGDTKNIDGVDKPKKSRVHGSVSKYGDVNGGEPKDNSQNVEGLNVKSRGSGDNENAGEVEECIDDVNIKSVDGGWSSSGVNGDDKKEGGPNERSVHLSSDLPPNCCQKERDVSEDPASVSNGGGENGDDTRNSNIADFQDVSNEKGGPTEVNDINSKGSGDDGNADESAANSLTLIHKWEIKRINQLKKLRLMTMLDVLMVEQILLVSKVTKKLIVLQENKKEINQLRKEMMEMRTDQLMWI